MIIGILQADSVLEKFQPEHGNYPEMFVQSLGDVDPEVEFRNYDVQHGEYPESSDECDAYVITGSKCSVYDQEAWIHELIEFVRQLHQAEKKIIGICFGHQMVAHALGGKTEPASSGWGVGIHQSEILHQQPFMQPGLREYGLVVSHKDQVTELPEGAELLATSEFCRNAMYRMGSHILALQGHPEFTTGYARDLMELRQDILGEQVFRKGISSLDENLDREIVAQWIIRFISEDETSHRHTD